MLSLPTMELNTNSKSLVRCKSLAQSSEVAMINVILQVVTMYIAMYVMNT